MNNRLRDFFHIFLFSILVLTLTFKLFNYFNKGFDFTDESFYILSYLYPLEFYNTPSLSHLFGHLLLIISDQNILNLRYSGFFILIFSSLIFCFGFCSIN